MTVITIPAHIPAIAEMESTPARALSFATDLRAVTVGVKDVQGWAQGIAAPEWEGETGEAHDHATTRFAVRLDSAEAGLDRAVIAADRFEERLSRLDVQRTSLGRERREVNAAAVALRADVDAIRGTGVDASILQALERRGERLMARAESVTTAIAEWVVRHDRAEADFIAALAEVDSVAEGEQAAAAPGRPDVDSLARRLEALRDDPVALAAWWATLSRAQRQALTTEHPHRVGNADGLPVRDRDEANRAALHSDIDYLTQRESDGQLTGAEKDTLDNARDVRKALGNYRDYLDPLTGRELAYVLVYKPDIHSGDGAVAISFGDPDTADHVSVNVPGLTSETSSTAGNLEKTLALHRQAEDEGNGTVASVYWLDYDAPSGNPINPLDPLGQLDFGGVALTAKADEGGERFADFIGGLRASDEGSAAHLTAIGHSYGSTTLGHALQDGLYVDDAILIGSPGVPEHAATELTGADVWVGSKDNDPVSLIGAEGGPGALGTDPAQESFGGTRFETGDGSGRIQDGLDNHTSYFEGESLDNMAAIVVDRDADVTRDEGRERWSEDGHYQTLPEWAVESSVKGVGGAIVDGLEDLGEGFVDSLSRGFGPGRWVG